MKKKRNIGTMDIVISIVIGLVLAFAIGFTIKDLYSKYDYLEIEVDHLKSRIDDFETEIDHSNSRIENEVRKIPRQEIEFYSDITDSAISRINSAVSILSVIAAIFGLLGIVFTVITSLKNKEIENKVEEVMEEMEDKVREKIKEMRDKVDEANKMIKCQRSEMDQMNTIQHILYADRHRKSKKFNYAIDEYLEALNIDEKDHLILYELGSLYADEYATNPTDLIFATAHDYLVRAIFSRKNDYKLISDCYMTLGGLYGQRGIRDNNKSDLKWSINHFEKSIECNSSNIDAYTNMALSYIYDRRELSALPDQLDTIDQLSYIFAGNELEEALNYFKEAKRIDDRNVGKTDGIKRYHNADELLAILGEETPDEIEDEVKKVEGKIKEIGEKSDFKEDKKVLVEKCKRLKEKKVLLKIKEMFKSTLKDLF